MGEHAIRARGLRKRYDDVAALAGVELEVARGEIFALLGPNGAGKTTAVEIFEGHRDREAGEVEVLDEDPGRAGRRWRSRIGIVLQTAFGTPELTVRESVRHLARYYPRPRNPDEIRSSYERQGLPNVTVAHVYTAGLMAAGLMVASFQNLGARITMDREDGTLKRLRGTPMLPSSHVVISGPLILLQFVSGIHVPFNEVPGWLYTLSSFFPLKWIAEGFRATLLPEAAVLAPERSGQLGLVALALGFWVVLGAVLVATTSRWRRCGEN